MQNTVKIVDKESRYLMKKSILDRYKEVLSNIEGIIESDIESFSNELYRRHSHGWTLPTSTYSRCKELLFYKESLERNSPYYVDLLKIEDRNNLKIVLKDLYHTIKIKR